MLKGPGKLHIKLNMPYEGVGIVEAQCGTLTHHYWISEKGIIQKADIIVGITNNHAAIWMSIKKAAQSLIKKGEEIRDGILNMIEMAFRFYEPCFLCATHSLPMHMPLNVNLRNRDGNIIRTIKRDLFGFLTMVRCSGICDRERNP